MTEAGGLAPNFGRQYNDVLSGLNPAFFGEDLALTAFQSEAEARRGAWL
jgi:hypothetical protein